MAKILVIDDSSMTRQTLRKILEGAGHEVIEAAEGLAALESYSLERPDAIFLDLTMPGLAGMRVLEELQRMDANARIVVATADVQVPTRRMAEEAGACCFINKPFSPGVVLDALNSALAEKSSNRSVLSPDAGGNNAAE